MSLLNFVASFVPQSIAAMLGYSIEQEEPIRIIPWSAAYEDEESSLDPIVPRETEAPLPALKVTEQEEVDTALDPREKQLQPTVWRRFEYTEERQVEIFHWANSIIQPLLAPFGLFLAPYDNSLDFVVVDSLLQPQKIIGYIHISIGYNAFKAQIVPKGVRYFDQVKKSVENCQFQSVRSIYKDALWRRIFYIIHFRNTEHSKDRIVITLRRLRSNYALSYWHQNNLKELHWPHVPKTSVLFYDMRRLHSLVK